MNHIRNEQEMFLGGICSKITNKIEHSPIEVKMSNCSHVMEEQQCVFQYINV